MQIARLLVPHVPETVGERARAAHRPYIAPAAFYVAGDAHGVGHRVVEGNAVFVRRWFA